MFIMQVVHEYLVQVVKTYWDISKEYIFKL